jgi:hypothetical protein
MACVSVRSAAARSCRVGSACSDSPECQSRPPRRRSAVIQSGLTIPIRRRQTMEEVAVICSPSCLESGPRRLATPDTRWAKARALASIARHPATDGAGGCSDRDGIDGGRRGRCHVDCPRDRDDSGWSGPTPRFGRAQGSVFEAFRDSRNPAGPPSSGTRLCREPGVTRSRLGDPHVLRLRLGAPGLRRTPRGRDHDANPKMDLSGADLGW